MSKFFTLVLIVAFVPLTVFGATFGSKSLFHVQTASTLKQGRLEFRSDMRFFTKVGDYLGQNRPPDFTAANYWLVQGNALFTYGIFNHVDASLNVRLYQDTHYSNEYNFPDDLFLDVKVGSFGFANDRFQAGGLMSFRFPTGEVHNYPFEPYTAGSLEFGFMGLFSFYKDPFLQDRDLSFHVNLGWYNHNDAGKVLYQVKNAQGNVIREYKASTNATAVDFGLGFSYPTELFDVNLELWGRNYITAPDSAAYSRENYMYLTPSIKFKPQWWLSFNVALDLRLSKDEDLTSPVIPVLTRNLTLPNYPAWKMTLGMSVILNQGREKVKTSLGEGTDIRKKVDFYERLVREKEKSKEIEEELKRLRREREQAQKQLEELKQLLEEQGK